MNQLHMAVHSSPASTSIFARNIFRFLSRSLSRYHGQPQDLMPHVSRVALLLSPLFLGCCCAFVVKPLYLARRVRKAAPTREGASTRISAGTAMTTKEDFESYDGGDYTIFIGRGMERFRRGEVEDSVSDFDRAIRLQPRLSAYMWQRGISLYYANQFEEGSKQFRADVALNPNDTEEAIWTFLCEARVPSIGFATAKQRLVKISNERRPYMRAAYSLFKGDAKESDLAKQMMEVSPGNVEGTAGSGAPYFYANLYLGLYAEAKGEDVLARKYVTAAVKSSYAKSGDYMCDVARVHKKVRGW